MLRLCTREKWTENIEQQDGGVDERRCSSNNIITTATTVAIWSMVMVAK